RLLRQLGHKNAADKDYSEAGRINCEGRFVSDRDPKIRPEMLGLSPFFQSDLSSFLDMLGADGSEAVRVFREDVKRDTGVEFDLRGGLNILGRTKKSPPQNQFLS